MAEAAGPVGSANLEEPVGPAGLAEPAGPAGPANLEEPAGPAGLAEPAGPVFNLWALHPLLNPPLVTISLA